MTASEDKVSAPTSSLVEGRAANFPLLILLVGLGGTLKFKLRKRFRLQEAWDEPSISTEVDSGAAAGRAQAESVLTNLECCVRPET